MTMLSETNCCGVGCYSEQLHQMLLHTPTHYTMQSDRLTHSSSSASHIFNVFQVYLTEKSPPPQFLKEGNVLTALATLVPTNLFLTSIVKELVQETCLSTIRHWLALHGMSVHFFPFINRHLLTCPYSIRVLT